ncbi:MAG: hypothetical protein ACD_72C00259G0002 [uncultured bacterium]|nr:MAG: hypothetical protein ACD_72C00259G0002 [uncultured bacterium]
MELSFDNNNQIIIKREELKNDTFDIGGRDIIIGFNEPAFKASVSDQQADIDSKLNARFVTYFLPAVEVARMQKKRPRLILVSGLNIALKWNANTEKEKKIMIINNNLKFDFLRSFFDKFFPEAFSTIDCIVAKDPTKISEDKLLQIWKIIETKYPEEIYEIKLNLARFKKPKLFNQETLSDEAKEYLNSDDPELLNSYKYAISHLLVLGDINFQDNYIHNPIGYLSIGGFQEKTFNTIRTYAHELLKILNEDFFDQKVIVKDNLKLIIENKEKTPPPYNGYYRKNGDRLFLDEVTYENNESLDFYDNHKKLKFEMEYMYENFVSKEDYTKFWSNYKERYFALKEKYKEAYHLEENF